MTTKNPDKEALKSDAPDAGGGLYSRRRFVQRGVAGAATLAAAGSVFADAPDSWRQQGEAFSNYGQPLQGTLGSRQQPIRWITSNSAVTGDGVSWTPLHDLAGTITPNGLHFERHHNGVAVVDPDSWELIINGAVGRSLAFNLDGLHRLPMVSRIAFLECGGNSNSLWHPNAVQAPAGFLHGLVSCAEWTGVRLSTLIDAVSPTTDAKWLVADGYDSAGVTVSLPLNELPEDAMLALYQNGETLRAENGYPARLLIPGWEGVTNLKWLRSLTLTDRPAMTRYDTVSYTDLLKDGTVERFSFEMGVKSLITSPSPGHTIPGTGLHEISGLAWTGAGVITRVELSADGGKSWADAELQQPVLDRAFTRFRAAWQWDGNPAVLKSRATDERGRVQPERQALIEEKGSNVYYHYNAVLAWAVAANGSLSHVYA